MAGKLFERKWRPPTLLLEKTDLRTLHKILMEHVKTAPDEQKDPAPMLGVEIRDREGAITYTYDEKEFDEEIEDSHPIASIRFENSSAFAFSHTKPPSNTFTVVIDFNEPEVFDLLSSPSRATQNLSLVSVSGSNPTWVNGAYASIQTFLHKQSVSRGFLHRTQAYEIFLFFVFIPALFYGYQKADPAVEKVFGITSPGHSVMVYLILTLGLLVAFRLGFNYLRWIMPFNEMSGKHHRIRYVHRRAWLFIIAAIVTGLIFEGFKKVLSL